MMTKHLRQLIYATMLIALLIPFGVSAQEHDETVPTQTVSQEELAQMLAPIALYPDALLSQMLMAAAYPFEVVEAQRWLTNNPYVTEDALDEALQAKDWDVSVLALCHYPKVLAMMSDNLSWTAALGDAFINQEEEVMDTVQELRSRAQEAGNLSTTSEQKVISENRVIRIEPYSNDYFYVPAYDPYYVYGSWWLPMFPPLAIFLPGLFVSGPGIIYSPRIEIGFGVWGWSYFNWRDRHVVIRDIDKTRRFNRHYYRYREADRRPWSPDRDRRLRREKRGGEIPRFRPPSASPRERWDRPPKGGVKTPGGRTITPKNPRVTDGRKQPAIPREKSQKPRWNQPQIQKDKTPAENPPPVRDRGKLRTAGPGAGDKEQTVIRDRDKLDRPHVIDGGKTQPAGPKSMDQGKPVIRDRGKMEQPRIINDSIPRPTGPGINDKREPVIRDRGGIGVHRQPDAVQKGIGGNPRVAPRGNRQEMPQRSMDRRDHRDPGGMREGGRK